MRRILLSFFGCFFVFGAFSQELVKVHNGQETFVTKVDYLTFDVNEDDSVFSYSFNQSLLDSIFVVNDSLSINLSSLSKQTDSIICLFKDTISDFRFNNGVLKDSISKLSSVIESNSLVYEDSLVSLINTLDSVFLINDSLIFNNSSLNRSFDSLLYFHDLYKADYNFYNRMTYTRYIPYVDLGLPSGNLWSEFNVGNSTQLDDQVGIYFMFASKESRISVFAYYDEFANDSYHGNVIDVRDTAPGRDVASVYYGNYWRTPTLNEFKELVDNCVWDYVAKPSNSNFEFSYIVFYKALNSQHKGKKASEITNHVYGKDDDFVVFPLTGYMDGSDLKDSNIGYYIAATRTNVFSGLVVSETEVKVVDGLELDGNKYSGFQIRPVLFMRNSTMKEFFTE